MIRKAYIVLAHKAPQQLRRLIGALDDGNSTFFVHLDSACDKAVFRKALAHVRGWQFLRSENGAWGQLGIVNATLNGLRAVAESHTEFDMVNLISGQDYPLRSNAFIDGFIERNRGGIFIEHFPLPSEMWTAGGLDRIHAYHFGDRRRTKWKVLSRGISALCNASAILKRRFPSGLKPYGGWQWWSISMAAVAEILEFVERRPDYVRFHRRSLLPDEMFFQTILLNSKSELVQRNLINNSLRFVDWDNPNPLTPATLTTEYFDALIGSRSLFARKFEADRDYAILDQLDEYRADEEKQLMAMEPLATGSAVFFRSADYPASPASVGTKVGLFREQIHEPAARSEALSETERPAKFLSL